MKKSKIRLILLIVASVALIVSLTIGGTLAWLTAQSDTLINTFTVGKITMTLDEAEIIDGKPTGDRIDSKKNIDTDNSYTIIPGATIDKDPTITIGEGSESCYVFAAIKTNLPVDVTDPNQNVIKKWDIGTGWEVVTSSSYTAKDGDTVTIYVFSDTTTKAPQVVTPTTTLSKLFETITFKGEELTQDILKAYETNKARIEIAAYAHQSEIAINAYGTAEAGAIAQFETVFPK